MLKLINSICWLRHQAPWYLADLCASLRSSWSPASAICQMSSTVSSASSPQHFCDPCIFCQRNNVVTAAE